MVMGMVVGNMMFYGFGVGEFLIVNSVLSDIIMVVKNIVLNMIGNMFNFYCQEIVLVMFEDVVYFYFIVLKMCDVLGMMMKLMVIMICVEVLFS